MTDKKNTKVSFPKSYVDEMVRKLKKEMEEEDKISPSYWETEKEGEAQRLSGRMDGETDITIN